MGFPGGSEGKTSVCDVGDPSLIPGSGRCPGEGNGSPIPIFLPGESHGQRSLEGYSPWGHKESDTKFVCFFIMCCSYFPNYTVGFFYCILLYSTSKVSSKNWDWAHYVFFNVFALYRLYLQNKISCHLQTYWWSVFSKTWNTPQMKREKNKESPKLQKADRVVML